MRISQSRSWTLLKILERSLILFTRLHPTGTWKCMELLTHTGLASDKFLINAHRPFVGESAARDKIACYCRRITRLPQAVGLKLALMGRRPMGTPSQSRLSDATRPMPHFHVAHPSPARRIKKGLPTGLQAEIVQEIEALLGRQSLRDLGPLRLLSAYCHCAACQGGFCRRDGSANGGRLSK